ncbi:MAG: FAD-dependent oxidoreductase, partial [Actinomycetes bacterium]
RTPVASYDTELDGFFWLVGQGGYGIETSPALSRCAAAILTGGPLPEDALARGLEPSDLNMNRLADVAEFLSH